MRRGSVSSGGQRVVAGSSSGLYCSGADSLHQAAKASFGRCLAARRMYASVGRASAGAGWRQPAFASHRPLSFPGSCRGRPQSLGRGCAAPGGPPAGHSPGPRTRRGYLKVHWTKWVSRVSSPLLQRPPSYFPGRNLTGVATQRASQKRDRGEKSMRLWFSLVRCSLILAHNAIHTLEQTQCCLYQAATDCGYISQIVRSIPAELKAKLIQAPTPEPMID